MHYPKQAVAQEYEVFESARRKLWNNRTHIKERTSTKSVTKLDAYLSRNILAIEQLTREPIPTLP